MGRFKNQFSDFMRRDTEDKMWELASFYSEDISKPGEVVDMFKLFQTLYSHLLMDLKTKVVLPFLIANDIDWAYLHLTILPRISSASAKFEGCLLLNMDEARLSNLTLLCADWDINRFATMKERRITL